MYQLEPMCAYTHMHIGIFINLKFWFISYEAEPAYNFGNLGYKVKIKVYLSSIQWC